MITSSLETEGPRYFGVYHGIVRDVADELGLHRVRIELPGLVEPMTGWALPATNGGGSPQRGGHVVPAVGSTVIVAFIGGSIERPVYWGGWWGIPEVGSEMPGDVANLKGAASAKVQSVEVGDFRVTVDETEGQQKFSMAHKVTGDAIQWDLEKAKLQIEVTAAIFLKSSGTIRLEAPEIVINDRLVAVSPKAI